MICHCHGPRSKKGDMWTSTCNLKNTSMMLAIFKDRMTIYVDINKYEILLMTSWVLMLSCYSIQVQIAITRLLRCVRIASDSSNANESTTPPGYP